ncbi:MAG: NAD(P)-binding protein, partial [Phycisphaerales bacterium]|nr:NAD(P)-binding protein [Phycisphaerales bacterium]
MSSVRVGIIGGGISGLSCAQALISAGCGVQIFDQGYRVGGRISTRTHMDGRVIADHGAPSFRVDDPGFQSAVHAWIDAGVCAAWDDRFVGKPSMGSISRHLAEGLPVQTSTRIERVKQIEDDSWEVSSEQAAVDDRFDQLVIAAQPREV